MDFVNHFMDYVREGFNEINAIQGIIIALFATFVMPRWGRLWFVALGATVVYVLADMLLPMMANNHGNQVEFKMPELTDPTFWHKVLVLYLGFLVAIAFFFFIKKNVIKGGH